MTDAVDDCGLRFLLATRHYMYLIKTLPLRQRAPLVRKGLSPSIIAWAFHSEAESELVDLATGSGAKTWPELRQLGIGWWVRSVSILKTLVERMAKSSFEQKRDPLDAALFYLALRKKNVLWGLFRSVDDTKMMEFFKRDFTEERWRKAALKNAFALLGRQRFEHAAAFFLLAGAVRDAIEVCLNKLDDLQLVLVIARLYDAQLDDGLPKSVKRLLYEECLGAKDENGLDRDITLAHPDPFIRSMSYWMLGEYSNALSTLLEPKAGSCRTYRNNEEDEEANVFNFYNYLRTHPLIVRQQIASVDSQLPLGGFSSEPTNVRVTPTERRLYFNTAYQHLRSGCPMLALEVLSRLPDVVLEKKEKPAEQPKKVNGRETADAFDWSQPLIGGGAPELILGIEEENVTEEFETKSAADDEMAQQMKMIACIKIMTQELSTLATGYEVDGGHLRAHLYTWLEKEMEALRQLCSYHVNLPEVDNSGNQDSKTDQKTAVPTLHEVLMAEKVDFDAKMERMSRRRKWLAAHERILRTLLAFSALHGAAGGGLASVRMELLLLLQELQQDARSNLDHSLPFPTTLPLVSSAVASVKTVVSDPIRHLCLTTRDLLKSILKLDIPPTTEMQTIRKVLVMRDIAAALSASIYQCLCDSDHVEPWTGQQPLSPNNFLVTGARRSRNLSNDENKATSAPADWPGVTSLRQLLLKGRDKDAPKVRILLLESLVAAYLSLLSAALALFDADALYRLVGHPLCATMWPALFGGGARKVVRVAVSENRPVNRSDVDKQRTKLTMRILGAPSGASQSTSLRDDKPTYKERYIAPETSMVTYLLTKPYENPHEERVDYDSADSAPSEDEEDVDEFGETIKSSLPVNTEHCDPNSYSWTLIRFAIVRHVKVHLRMFIPAVGVELVDLPVVSPLLHSVLRTLEDWDGNLSEALNSFGGPPQEYIPTLYVDSNSNGPALLKYKAMRDVHNTPFASSPDCLPVKRLWYYLVRQDSLQDVFIRYLFKKRQPNLLPNEEEEDLTDSKQEVDEAPMKILHREQDDIVAFCLNQVFLDK